MSPLARPSLIQIGPAPSDCLGRVPSSKLGHACIGCAFKRKFRRLSPEVNRIDRGHYLELVRASANRADAPIELLFAKDGDGKLTHGEPSCLLSLFGRRDNHALIDALRD